MVKIRLEIFNIFILINMIINIKQIVDLNLTDLVGDIPESKLEVFLVIISQNMFDSCYVIYNRKKNNCELLINEQNNIKKLVDILDNYLPDKTILWYKINIDSKINKKNIMLGFNNAYISNNEKKLCLYRIKKSNKKTLQKTISDIQELINSDNICSLQVKLSSNTIKQLKNLCLNGKSKNKDGTITQKEFGGELTLNRKNDTYIVNTKEDSITVGDEENVSIKNSIYNFHTHPKQAYLDNNVTNGWPSSQDYLGYLYCLKKFSTIFHIVISVEGFYVISLHKDRIGNNINIDKKFILKNYDYFGSKISRKKYIHYVNNIEHNKKKIFNVQYIPWKNSSKVFSVLFQKKNNCFPPNTLEQQIYYTLK